MAEALSILSVGAGTLLAIVVFAVIVFLFIQDITQKKHAVLRNYPVIGRMHARGSIGWRRRRMANSNPLLQSIAAGRILCRRKSPA